MSLQIIILAAGLGKRMCSKRPKVLQPLGGKPMLQHVVETSQQLNPDAIHVIYGHQGALLQKAMIDHPIHWVEQTELLGTGHAVAQTLPFLNDCSNILVLSGDVPLIHANTLQKLITCGSDESLRLLTANFDNPFGLGRILRDDEGKILGIVEEKDANDEQRQVKEVYSGILCAPALALKQWLPTLSNDNAQQEYYLTEIIAMAAAEGIPINHSKPTDNIEVFGANNHSQLHHLERALQRNQAEQLMGEGVCLADADRIDIRGELCCGQDVAIDINCVFEGKVSIGNDCHIQANCTLKNVTIDDGSVILANSVLEDCHIGPNNAIGPFARIRPGTNLSANCKVGNFVEIKKTTMGQNSKASHLSYLGDATIGKDVNIGAGTITCNYDGANKYQTVIEDGAFIGSDTQLVAPVTIGNNATIGAGSTIRRNAPAEQLTLTESKQRVISGWKRKNINKN